jgi:hypothetical protein
MARDLPCGGQPARFDCRRELKGPSSWGHAAAYSGSSAGLDSEFELPVPGGGARACARPAPQIG